MSDPIVGIDLGTSNSVVGYCDVTGAVRVLADEAGFKIHPSVVSFHPSGGVVVGAPAKQRKVIDPANTIYSVKRLLGRTYNSTEVQTSLGRVPFQIKEGPNQMPMIVTRGGDFAVPEISAIVLDHLRNLAATALDTEVSRAVVTVPANFNDAQRTATATAGAIAGITVMRVLNEPTAAALAYGHTRNLRQIIAVYDFGGGTFDITLLRLQDEVYEVLGTAGDSFLGGDDLDERLVEKMVTGFLAENRIDLRSNEIAMMRLRAVAEQTKIELSRRSRAVVRIDEIAYGAKGSPLNLQIELTRDEFVKQVADIIDRTFPVCRDALRLAGLDTSQIDDVVLVGGTTKIPYVRDQVSKFFAKAPRTDVNPEEAVAVGAALQASALERALAKPSTKLPSPEATEADYEFGTEDESLTFPQGARGEPTDPRAKIRPEVTSPGALLARTSTDDIEGVDTNVSAAPTAEKPDVKRLEGGYSERGKAVDRFEEKTTDGKPIGRMGQKSGVSPISKVPSRTFAGPLPPVTRMEPKVKIDPRLRKSGLGPSGAPQPPRGRQTPVPSVEPPDPRGDTAMAMPVPDSPAAGPSADTMNIDVPETPMPPVRTAAGVGGPARAPTKSPIYDLPEPDDDLAAALAEAEASFSGLSTDEDVVPRRERSTFAAVQIPDTNVGPMPEPPAPNTAPGPFTASQPPAVPTIPAFVPPAPPQMPTLAMSAPPPMPAPRQAPPPRPPPPQPAPPAFAPPPVYPPPQPYAQPTPYPQQPPPYTPQQMPIMPMPAPLPPPPQAPQRMPPPPQAPAPAPILAPPKPVRAPVVLDVTPRGLGIGTVAGYCEELIRRNSRVPAEIRKLFTTSRDMQDLVRIVVCQGESRRLDNNVVLGDLVLDGLPKRSRGETSIEVTFTLDVSGILQVRARDAQTGAEQRASVDLLGAMPDEDVEGARERLQALRR